MLERKELFLLNGEEIELELVDGRYYAVTLDSGASYVYKYLKSEIDPDSVTTASKIVDLGNNVLCQREYEYEELKVISNERIDDIVALPKSIGDYIMSDRFWKTSKDVYIKRNSDSNESDLADFLPKNFVESMYAKQKGLI